MADAPILLIGAGRMGGALLKGWLARGLGPVVVVETHPSAELRKLAKRGVTLLKSVEDAPRKIRALVIALKPQILKTEAVRLKAIAASGAPVISIAAGSSIKLMKAAWGKSARIVRTMPNTPGAIGEGISALYAPPDTTVKDRKLAESLLAALGETVWVKREADIDAVTSVSGSGPAYLFLMVEALAAAGAAEGLPADVALRLARKTVIGAGALLKADPSPAELLRKNVTSPHGTTEAALKVLMAKDGLPALMRRAVSAARKRAKELAV
ncbi:MAG TPA: pyrroline-5-carboxylate reductase [Rhizomicrobium sp.]|nr:pyrroline-5-carboxylate reductase [Rhizomicrobium sp.]